MKAVIQRVLSAKVEVDNTMIGEIGHGLIILLGVAHDDTEDDVPLLCDKIVKMRIFEDENDKMNLSLKDVGGEMLVVSNFTLNANYKHGNRPDYLAGAKPDVANRLYEYFIAYAKEQVKKVESGCFGEHMKLTIINDGPVTICVDSEVLRK
ncbi:MAG: D-tyrosyl-tRNA(Tyr) deacylase [Ruminococcaceae bacterium]|nr:D-tyrosyl-tRNA(Tyr) deacylase [Oscillospiraceae bacterium]